MDIAGLVQIYLEPSRSKPLFFSPLSNPEDFNSTGQGDVASTIWCDLLTLCVLCAEDRGVDDKSFSRMLDWWSRGNM
jgi:hypothetical protein